MIENPSTQNRNQDPNFQEKIRLTHQLKENMPQYNEILGIFEQVLEERKKYRSALGDFPTPALPDDPALYASRLKNGIPLLDRNTIDFNNRIMADHLIRLARIMATVPPGTSAEALDAFQQKEAFNLNAFMTGTQPGKGIPLSGDLMDFLVSETLNPVLAIYAEKIKNRIDFTGWNRGYCPVCGEFATLAALSEETGKRKLISLACGTEWEFPRVACPFCETDDQGRLSYLYIENDPRYRIETCDHCRRYIKTIDLRHATLPVDYEVLNIITVHLDLIAREKGYRRQESVEAARSANAVYH